MLNGHTLARLICSSEQVAEGKMPCNDATALDLAVLRAHFRDIAFTDYPVACCVPARKFGETCIRSLPLDIAGQLPLDVQPVSKMSTAGSKS